MQSVVELDSVKRRCDAIGVGLASVAQAAGVHYSTLARNLAGKSEARHSTIEKVKAEVARRERALLVHLARLHPDLAALKQGLYEAEAAE